jgi:hypothetical protein
VEAALSGLPLAPGFDAITGGDVYDLAQAVAERINDVQFLNLAARSALAKCRHAFHWQDRGKTLAEAMVSAQDAATSSHSDFPHPAPANLNIQHIQ